MDVLKDVLSITGGVLGALAFFWKLSDVLISYFQLDVKVSDATVLATVENKGLVAKRVHYAALLIGPEQELPKITMTALAQELAGEDAPAEPIRFLAARRP